MKSWSDRGLNPGHPICAGRCYHYTIQPILECEFYRFQQLSTRLVLWVPDEYRPSLWWPGLLLLIGREPLSIDFATACHGTQWAKCQ
ncbi:hypothetical protein BD311DRAFT_677709 [Dichomitus squalens]|uniref:Uncharacterized protein n=1 Tax=Dichomitus squalens TaxID=114155 RepID=A0A4Q9M5Z1_9APHY|nr:hypothetical protein BD311DRAFT_677709 [Dichomitus squalens]